MSILIKDDELLKKYISHVFEINVTFLNVQKKLIELKVLGLLWHSVVMEVKMRN